MAKITYEKWLDDLERIQKEIITLHFHRQLWRELAEITQNADLPATIFFPVVGNWYSAVQTVGIRRQVDRDRKTVSLWRLLQEISEHPSLVDRTRHVDLLGDDEFGEANPSFDRFTAKPGDRYIDRTQVEMDQKRMRHDAAFVIQHVNQRIAHTQDLPPAEASLTYGDIDRAIDTLGATLHKYTGLLRATHLVVEPVVEPGWKMVFTKPWLTGWPWDGTTRAPQPGDLE